MRVLYAVLAGYALCSQGNQSAVRKEMHHEGMIHHVVANRSVGIPGMARGRDRPGRAIGEPVVNRDQLKSCCQKISGDIQRIYYLNCRNGKMKLVVRGVYVYGGEMFFAIRLTNRSALDYTVDSIRLFVAEKERGSPSLRRLEELKPVFIYDSATLVKGHGRVTSVVVIPRLTLARHRRLQIEVLEKRGTRQLIVQTANFTLEMAKSIGDGKVGRRWLGRSDPTRQI
jgi:hypothetical protein